MQENAFLLHSHLLNCVVPLSDPTMVINANQFIDKIKNVHVRIFKNRISITSYITYHSCEGKLSLSVIHRECKHLRTAAQMWHSHS